MYGLKNKVIKAVICAGLITVFTNAYAQDAKPSVDTPVAKQTNIQVCGEKWKARKTDASFNKETETWPKFWSACNKELKAAK